MKHKPVTIEWRVRSQAKFLPASDLRWSRFCELTAGRRERYAPTVEAKMIVVSLNTLDVGQNRRFEYRIRP